MEQDRTPYVDAVMAFDRRDPAHLHIPGHKAGAGSDPAVVEALGAQALRMDIPSLIEGIDIDREERSPFAQAEQLAAEAWGARRTWFLVAGASQGNHAACLAIRHRGRRVVMQRNVHSSAIDGVILAGLEPVFVAPEVDPELGIAHCITADALGAALDANPGAVAAMCVSPTYFGACADIEALAAVAHERGVPLIDDEAWGAHLTFSDRLPRSALDQGADVVVSSTHKIVGSLSQSAMLHLGAGDRVDEAILDRAVTLVESTSPSSILTISLDGARRQAAVHGQELLDETLDVLAETRERIRAIPGLDVLDERITETPGVAGWDPLRLSVDVRGTGISGHRFAALLVELAEVHVELASETVVVATFGLGGEARPLAGRFVDGVERVRRRLGEVAAADQPPFALAPPWGPLDMSPRDAYFAPQEAIPISEAEGRIACESLAAYPPGIPNVLPGERLTRETLDFIGETVAGGGHLRGASDRTLGTIRVVIE